MSTTGGGNEAAGAAEAAAAAGEGGEGADPTIAQLTSRLDEFGQRFEAFGQQLEGLTPAEEEESEEEAGDGEPDLTPVFSEEDFDERGDLSLEAQTREIQRLIKAGIEAELTPEREARAQEQRDAYTDALEERYPDLQDPEKQEKYINATIEFARQIGRPELAREPVLLERVYLSERAKEAAAGEIPAGSQQEVTLERGGGAGPAAAASDTRGDNIVKATTRSQFRLGRAKA
jgi:hypothetical protein